MIFVLEEYQTTPLVKNLRVLMGTSLYKIHFWTYIVSFSHSIFRVAPIFLQ
jgi:hypothetical protein